ncbi:MAG: HAMP domain-containing sensor histidine kinase, partial [Halarcobacter sp.]
KNIDGGNITIILTQIEESVKIKIVDDGIGLSDKIIEKVFEPYFTTKKDGDGIGLYMAKLIIEKKMHGKLNAYVQEIGAKFLITLPKLENEDDENITT